MSNMRTFSIVGLVVVIILIVACYFEAPIGQASNYAQAQMDAANKCVVPRDACSVSKQTSCINSTTAAVTYDAGVKSIRSFMRNKTPCEMGKYHCVSYQNCAPGICSNGTCLTKLPAEISVSRFNCSLDDADCQKAEALFNLITAKVTESGMVVQGVFDKDQEFTLHQFAVVYDALISLPENLRSSLKILLFTKSAGEGPVTEAVSHPDRGELAFGYGTTYKNFADDTTLHCTVIHEMGHLIEPNIGTETSVSFRSICFVPDEDSWKRSADCTTYDFAPQFTESGWDDSLRERTGGNDGTEDISNSIAYYVCAGNLFRAETAKSSKMKEKYLFLKYKLFNGKEYKCEIDSCPAISTVFTSKK